MRKRTKKELLKILEEQRIFNSWEFAGKGNVYITRISRDNKWHRAQFKVIRPGFKTDPNAHWMDDGCKVFYLSGRDKFQETLKEAQDWAGEKYGIKEWVKTPFGDWMDKEFVEVRLNELIENGKN